LHNLAWNFSKQFVVIKKFGDELVVSVFVQSTSKFRTNDFSEFFPQHLVEGNTHS
jgi:hypothetical protein